VVPILPRVAAGASRVCRFAYPVQPTVFWSSVGPEPGVTGGRFPTPIAPSLTEALSCLSSLLWGLDMALMPTSIALSWEPAATPRWDSNTARRSAFSLPGIPTWPRIHAMVVSWSLLLVSAPLSCASIPDLLGSRCLDLLPSEGLLGSR